MPLSRFQLRNEYGLGVRELYGDASKREDPKGVLDGVAVAGLVGLLRQLGDLAEFAAEVFHGLQEQVTNTASRSRKLMTRVKHLEAALPPLEKALLSQTSHIHFAYTPGSEWHARISNEQNHFIYTDLPRCIMDTYEECREPPRLQLLDKFDIGGPGSCLKRYSDPTFFRRVSRNSGVLNDEKSNKEKKARRTKKRRSWKRSSQLSVDTLNFDSSGRVHFSSPTQQRKSSPTQTVSTFDMTFKSDLVDQPDSLGSGDGTDFIECIFHTSASVQADETKTKQQFSGSVDELMNDLESKHPEEQIVVVKDDNARSSILEKNSHRSLNITWDKKPETAEPMVLNCGMQKLPSLHETSSEFGGQATEPIVWKSRNGEVREVHETTYQFDEPEIEPNRWNSRSYEVPELQETNFEADDLGIEPMGPICRSNEMPEVHMTSFESDDQEMERICQHSMSKGMEFDDLSIEPMGPISRSNDMPEVHEMSFEFDDREMEPIGQHSMSKGMEFDDLRIEPTGPISRNNEMPEVHETSFVSDDREMESIGQHSIINYIDFDDLAIEPAGPVSRSNEMPKVHEANFESDDRETESIGQHSGGNKTLEMSREYLQHDEQEKEPEIEENFSVVRTSFEGVDSPKLISDKHEPDEIESETDNFVDALNTIESESENDFDWQTKGELESCSHPKDDLEDDVHNEQITDNIDDHSLESESPSTTYNDLDTGKFNSLNGSISSLLPVCEESLLQTSASHDISSRERCENPESSVSSVHSPDDAPVQNVQSSSVQDVSSRDNFIPHDDNTDGLQQESAAGELSSPEHKAADKMLGTGDEFVQSPYVSQQPSFHSSNVGSFALWTNGGLLGLQPSKPPDFNASDGANVNNSITIAPSYHNFRPEDDHIKVKLDSSAKGSRCDYGDTDFKRPTLVSDTHEIESTKEMPLQTLNSGLKREPSYAVDSDLSKSSTHSQSQLLPSVMHPEAKAHGGADVKDTLGEPIHLNKERSSFFSEIGHSLLVSGFQRSRSMEYDEKPESVSCQKTDDIEHGPHVTLCSSFSGTNLTEDLHSPLISAPPSPPLEHMKISFQPINSFETSKLKLKYPEGIDHHDETSNAFPSFQLVPEPTLQHSIDSDTDDDTFCRSNPCMSDDDLSHLSDSNSELWESGDSSESRDHISYNGLHRISSGEYISSFTEHKETSNCSINHNGFGSIHSRDKLGVEYGISRPLLDIAVLQAMNPFGFQETKISKNPIAPMEPFDLQEPTPEPPPLPPLQWRVSKPQSDPLEGKESTVDPISSFSDSMNPGSMFPQEAKPTADDPSNAGNEHMNVAMRIKQFEEQKKKINVLENLNQAVDRGRMDEREDFLHQIRTKSFNLRKTGLLKPTPTPVAPATNVKVTAILAKANAIRQAVASDDGEDDDPWSDT